MDRVQEIPLNQTVGDNDVISFHREVGAGDGRVRVQRAKTLAFLGTLIRRKTEREARNAPGTAD